MGIGFSDHVEQRGVQKGRRELLREVLEDRFGPLSTETVARLEAWPSDRLRELVRALLSAQSLQELGLGGSEATGD
jgi:hypothetical protein